MPGNFGAEYSQLLDAALVKHIKHYAQPSAQQSLIQHISEMPINDLVDEMALLGSISNYHWWNFVKVCGPSRSSPKPTVRFSSHLLFTPDVTSNQDGPPVAKHAPTSPRNRLMYFLCSEGMHGKTISLTISKLLSSDRGEQAVLAQEVDFQEHEPAAKKRKHGARLLTLNRTELSRNLGVDLNEVLNSQDPNRNLFSYFSEQLITDGVIHWRHHSEDSDTVVMSDYDGATGQMVPSSYVHVKSTKAEETGQVMLKCSCAAYKLIRNAVLQKFQLLPGEEGVLDGDISCMHCRFFKECLCNFFDDLSSNPDCLTLLQQKVQDTLQSSADPVHLLGNVLPHTATKFSVSGLDVFSVVTLTFRQGQAYARCLDGVCGAHCHNKKKCPKVIRAEDSALLCSHLNTFFQNFDVVKAMFPGQFAADVDGDGEVPAEGAPHQPEVPFTDDATLTPNLQGNFDVQSGLWTFASHSKHQPREMLDLDLIRYVVEHHRDRFTIGIVSSLIDIVRIESYFLYKISTN